MNYYLLQTTGDLNDDALCLLDSPPEGMGIHYYRLARGVTAKKHFPDNAKVYLPTEYKGIKLSGVLGNIRSFLIVSTLAKDIIQRLCGNQKIEFFNFTLYNHKKRVHSTDYYFVNPIGSFDCLKEKSCNIKFSDDGDIITFDQIVFDKKKLKSAPHLFRIKKMPVEYVISRKLALELGEAGITNLIVKNTPIE